MCHLLAVVGAVLFFTRAEVLEGMVESDMDGSL